MGDTTAKPQLETAILAARWPDGALIDAVTTRTAPLLAQAVFESPWLVRYTEFIAAQARQHPDAAAADLMPRPERRRRPAPEGEGDWALSTEDHVGEDA